ncbi:MAG: hypothetical protein B6I28_00515 [Fusobacteriia bacterium 4572_132]|nr:MAG: hypothetical protein B6I28_00515 [Fusobacteriia bacterium 4572_132]
MKPQRLLILLLISIMLVNVSLFFQMKLKEENNKLLMNMYDDKIRLISYENDIKAMEEHRKYVDEFMEEFSYLSEEKENTLDYE